MTATDYARRMIMSSGKSINSIANSAGIPPTTIYSIANGRCRNIGVNTLFLISVYGLGMSLSEFFENFEEDEDDE